MKWGAWLGVVALSASLASSASGQLSETDRKASARAAYLEGVKLQDDGKYDAALARFEAAQKLYDAPTNLLHMAECQALTGKLVEGAETYETLIRKTLPAGSPDAFHEAQEEAQTELGALRARIPTLRLDVSPAKLEALEIEMNGSAVPPELVGVARPLNPGVYQIRATATGYATASPTNVELREREARKIELVLAPQGIAALAAPPDYRQGKKLPDEVVESPSQRGLLLGTHLGGFIPGGSVSKNVKFDEFAGAGFGASLDVVARLARSILLGGTFEYARLGSPDKIPALAANETATSSASTFYLGLVVGLLPNVDRVSFYGDVGLGFRGVNRTLEDTRTVGTNVPIPDAGRDDTYGGAELSLGMGVSIPAGPLRFVPKAALNLGAFGSCSGTADDCSGGSVSDGSAHVMFFLGVGAYYHVDFAKKTRVTATLQ